MTKNEDDHDILEDGLKKIKKTRENATLTVNGIFIIATASSIKITKTPKWRRPQYFQKNKKSRENDTGTLLLFRGCS